MVIDWLKFLSALVLLLPPIAKFHGKNIHYRALMRDWNGYWGKTVLHGAHAIDLLRATSGAWLLAESLKTAPGSIGVIRYAPLVVQTLLLCTAVALQTCISKEIDTANAPFAFVAGLVIGFVPTFLVGFAPAVIVSFALLIAIAVAAGAHTPSAFFPVLALAVVGLGALYSNNKAALLLPLGVIAPPVALPWLITLLFPRHFVVSHVAKYTEVLSEKR